jgi:hypothetical protein
LAEVAETAEAYAIRRIWWATECSREEQAIPPAGELQIRAAVSYQMLQREEVRKAYDKAIRSFRKSQVSELLKAG